MDLLRQRFGCLTVLARAASPSYTKEAFWLCRCDCGDERIRRGVYLRTMVYAYCNACPPEIRFWLHVKKTEACWLWTGAPADDGYGQFKVERKTVRAHRFSYTLHYGVEPGDLCVCHACDTPLCVRPAHLFLGTQQDNENDKLAKKRQALGEKNGNAVLDALAVQRLRELRAAGSSYRVLATEFGLDHTTVAQIVRRKTWRHV